MLEKLKEQGLRLIPARELIIQKTDITYGYDFTVDKTYTFATHDGVFVQDTMAIILPQTKNSQEELKEAVKKLYFQASTGDFKFKIAWDVIYGLFKITKQTTTRAPSNFKFSDADELLEKLLKNPKLCARKYNTILHGNRVELNLGLLLINLYKPKFFTEIIDKPITKKYFQQLMNRCAELEFEKTNAMPETLNFYKKLLDIGRTFATLFPMTIDVTLSEEIEKKFERILKKMAKANLFEGVKTIQEVMEKVKEYIKKKNPELYDAVESGARGSWDDIQQMLVVKGYITDALGRILPTPILSNLSKGLNKEEFFATGYAARKGIVDKAINTSGPGYLLRRLVIMASPVLLSERVDDCGTKNYLTIKVEDEKTARALINRYTSNNTLITEKNYKQFIGKTVAIRSPMFCLSPRVCHKCYGTLYKKHRSYQIGVIAAQSIGERIQQSMLRTFHTGGIARLKGMPQIFTKNDDLKRLITQDGDLLYVDSKYTLRIPLTEDVDYSLKTDALIVKSGIITFQFIQGERIIEHTFSMLEQETPFELEFYYDDVVTINDRHYVIITGRKDPVARIWLVTVDVSTQMKNINAIFNASVPYTSYEEYLRAAWKILKDYNVPLVHLEIILSQMMRWAEDPGYPYRLKQKGNYIIVGSKSVPYYEGPLLALAFEDIGRALLSGMLHDGRYRDHKAIFEEMLEGDTNSIKRQVREVS